MQFTKGMRDKLEKYFDIQNEIEIVMEISGDAVYDFSCFGVDRNNKLSDERYMIFYNQMQSPDKEIVFVSDSPQRGHFKIRLDKMPNDIDRLVFAVTIDGDGTMATVDYHKVSVLQNGKEGISLNLAGKDFASEKAIISIEIYKKGNWRIAAVANGFNSGLAALLSYFGGVEDTQPNQTKVVGEQMSTNVRTDVPKKETAVCEVINPKNDNGDLTKICFKYNPYKVESQILIDGQEIESGSRLYTYKNMRIQEWLDQFLPLLIDTCNDNSFQIDFYGLRLDYEDFAEIIKDYCVQHTEVEVHLSFTEARSSAYRIDELKRLFEEMQKDCPFADLKTDQIRESFYSAIGSEFEVSVIATMSSGKSTLINSLLGRELMPSKNEACTATIARIKDCGSKEQFSAVYTDKENKVLGQYDNLSLGDMEEMNANPNTAYIDIQGNIPNIDSTGIQLVLVDTPGPNNSRTEDHKNHTYKVIKERTKPMVLYVLNATQLQTNDDFQLLSAVAEAMKVGGKQSRDRFLFAVNKIDQFDPDKESVRDTLDHVREYLGKFDIVNPNIFPTSAEMAKVIRMYHNGAALTKGQKKTLSNCDFFIEEKQLHLSEQASLGRNNMLLLEKAVNEAKQSGDKYQEVLLYTGIPAVELAINEYLKKYAYTAKIKSAVDTFKKKIEEKDMHAKMLESIQNNEGERNRIHQQLENVKKILDEGHEAEKFRDKIEALDMMRDAKKGIRALRAKVTKTLAPSSDKKGAMTILEVQQLMMNLNTTIQHLQSDVKTELDNIINDVIINNANTIIAEYREHLHGLIQSGELQEETYHEKSETGIAFLEMNIPNAQEIIDNYKYEEEYDTGETEWVENTGKRWFKPWTWFQASGHYRTIYANREMVDYETVENEYLAPVMKSFMENIDSARSTAEEEAEKFKGFFMGELSKLETALRKKVEENEKLTQDQSSIDAMLEKERENIQWLDHFMRRLDRVLEI